MQFLSPKQISEVIKIENPLDWCIITQGWGVNYLDFYQKLGMKGHNGQDYRADDGTPCYACFDGVVEWAGEYAGYGINVLLKTDLLTYGNQIFSLEAVYGHLKSVFVKKGQRVTAGEVLGQCDNTGKYTTASHLHFGIRPNYAGQFEDNGYHGWIDPSELFKDRGWYLTPVEKRYNTFYKKSDPKWRPWSMFIKEKQIGFDPYQIMFLRRLPTNIEIAAQVYGGWSLADVSNPALYPTWGTLTKKDYEAGVKRPIRLIM